MVRPKDVPIHEMLDDLRFIRLSQNKRASLNAAKFLLERDGSLPLEMVNNIRKLYKRYTVKLREMHEARERGRISLAKAAMKLTDDEIEQRRDDRLESLRKKLTDLGF